MNAPAATLDRSGPELLNDPDSRCLCDDMVVEAQHVLARAEIKLKPLPGNQSLPDMVAAFRRTDFTPPPLPNRPTHVSPSMWPEVFCWRGRTEGRYLDGRVHEAGQQLGIATSVNALLTQLVDTRAERRELPGTYTLTNLRRMRSPTSHASG